MSLELLKQQTIAKIKELSEKGLLFEKQTEVATNAEKIIDIYIYIVNNARNEQELNVVENLIKGMSEGFNFQRVPTITNDTLVVLEKSKYQPKEWDVDSSHHKVIICDNTKEKEHWEKTQKEIEELKQNKPEGYQEKIKQLKKGQFILAPDNLDVLNNLMCDKTIRDHGGIDVIYIDPPYNTGDINLGYRDVREQNEWLNFMKARLEVARQLMSDNGVIFISIDDHMQAYLKIICDEVFGEENFINQFVWISNLKGRQISNVGAAKTHEYILCYTKNIIKINEFVGNKEELIKEMPSIYKMKTNSVMRDEKGEYVIKNELFNSNSIFNESTRPNLVYDIYYNPKTLEVRCEELSNKHVHKDYFKISPKSNNNGSNKWHAWRWSKNKVISESSELFFEEIDNGKYKIWTKIRDLNKVLIKDVITSFSTGSLQKYFSSKAEMNNFLFPKPASLIEFLIEMLSLENIFILDFFGGSGTTAESVMKINKKSIQKNMYYICTKKYDFINEGFHNIAEDVMLERISRVSLGKSKDGKSLTSQECPWLEDNKPYNEKFDVLVTKEYDISLNTNFNLYKDIDLSIYGYTNINDYKKIIDENFDLLLNHLNNKK